MDTAELWDQIASGGTKATQVVAMDDDWPEDPHPEPVTATTTSTRSFGAAAPPKSAASESVAVEDVVVIPKQAAVETPEATPKPHFDGGDPAATMSAPPTLAPPALIAPRSVHPAPPVLLQASIDLFRGSDGQLYLRDVAKRNAAAVRLTMRKALALLAPELIRKSPKKPSMKDVRDDVESIMAWAEEHGPMRPVWYRVAKIEGGVEIDMGDADHTRIRITAAGVEFVASGSETLFYRTKHTRPLTRPADMGDLSPLKKFVNLSDPEFKLLIAWLSYTLASPKADTTNYVILVLQGGQGSGKSWLCKYVILRLIDPSALGVQRMPKTEGDLAIGTQDAHVVCYDNVRGFKSDFADLLCIVSTGGQVAKRQLYTDSELSVVRLHGALVLNGIHTFVGQSDLAQRCLPLHLQPIPEAKRQSESDMQQELEAALPEIQLGLFDLIAAIIKALPDAKVMYPERMYDFVRWLAAMEIVDGVPAGVYQAQYSDTLGQGQLDSLLDNVLAAAIVEFADTVIKDKPNWSGKPADLLVKLEMLETVTEGTKRSRDWPSNPIALSKRLVGLEASLLTQGIKVERTRGKERVITITKVGGRHE